MFGQPFSVKDYYRSCMINAIGGTAGCRGIDGDLWKECEELQIAYICDMRHSTINRRLEIKYNEY